MGVLLARLAVAVVDVWLWRRDAQSGREVFHFLLQWLTFLFFGCIPRLVGLGLNIRLGPGFVIWVWNRTLSPCMHYVCFRVSFLLQSQRPVEAVQDRDNRKGKWTVR